MPNIKFDNNTFYHIHNRTIDYEKLFPKQEQLHQVQEKIVC